MPLWVAWHLLLMLRISLMILICGITSHSSRRICCGFCRLDVGVKRPRIAFPSWSHNCPIGLDLACRWSRMILAVWGRALSSWRIATGPNVSRYGIATGSKISYRYRCPFRFPSTPTSNLQDLQRILLEEWDAIPLSECYLKTGFTALCNI